METSDEEEIEEDPVQKQLNFLKNQHEKALNEDSLAHQEVRDAWDVDVFRNVKLGSASNLSKMQKMSDARKKKEETKTAASEAKVKVLEFAKSHNIEPYSGKVISLK